ncbi:MAG: glycosyltransferase family 9 protein [Calditrichia bacterium]|nr:glycosyltransferase family 9 protein [Calditrichia bacterium]
MKKLEKWLKQFLIFLIKILLPGKNNNKINDDWHNFKRVLVFRLDNRFGNSILILSLVQSIKKSLPGAAIDVMMTSSYIALYKNHPDISRIIQYDQKHLFRNPLRFLFLIKNLRKNNYDIVFSSSNPDALSVSQALFCRLVTKGRSVGFDWKDSAKIYSVVVRGNTTIHYSAAQVDLWRHFDAKAEFTFPKLYFIHKNTQRLDQNILLWLGATGNKILNEELITFLVKIFEEINLKYVIAAGPFDDKIIANYSPGLRANILIQNLDLGGIASWYRTFNIICMPDTGPMHMVAALDIPLIQVFVNSNVKQYGYRGPNKYIIDKEINADSLKQFVRKQLDSAP